MKIEVIIPAYNCTKTLRRTLSSLETQTDINFTVHIIDDCSTEDLSLIISEYKNTLDIRVTRNSVNLGCGMSRQVGIDNTEADYIAFLDSDDVLMPYTVEVWRNMANSSPSVDIFHSYFYEQTIIDSLPSLVLQKEGYTWCHGKLYKVEFLKRYNIRNNPFVKYADDSYFNSICIELGVVAKIPIAMYLWLNNLDSITRCGKIPLKDSFEDFIDAMLMAVEYCRKCGKDKVNHLSATLKNLEVIKDDFDEETLKKYNKLRLLNKEWLK